MAPKKSAPKPKAAGRGKKNVLMAQPAGAASVGDDQANKRARLGSKYFSAADTNSNAQLMGQSFQGMDNSTILTTVLKRSSTWPSALQQKLAQSPQGFLLLILEKVIEARDREQGGLIENAPPLEIGKEGDHGWAVGWETTVCMQAYSDPKARKVQTCLNFFAIDLLSVRSGVEPDLGVILDYYKFFYPEPRDLFGVFECVFKVADPHSVAKQNLQPPPRCLQLVSSVIPAWAAICGMFATLVEQPERMKEWLRPVRSAVVRIHNPQHDTDACSIEIFADQALHTKHKTQTLNVLDKGRVLTEVKSKLQGSSSIPAMVSWLKERDWSDPSTAYDSVNVVTLLLKAHACFNQDDIVKAAVRENIFLCGQDFYFRHSWKVEAIMGFLPSTESRLVTEFLQFSTLACKRGDLANGEVGVGAMRSKNKVNPKTKEKEVEMGIVACIGFRAEIINDLKQKYDLGPVLEPIFANPWAFDKYFPSQKEVRAMAALGHTLQADGLWRNKVKCHLGLKLADELKLLFGGDKDEQIIESYALLAISKPTLHQLIEKPPLAQIYQNLDLALQRDKEEEAANAEGQIKNGDATAKQTSAIGSAADAALPQKTELEEKESDAMQHAMLKRVGLLNFKVLSPDASVTEIQDTAQELEGPGPFTFGKGIQLRGFDCSGFGEAKDKPWDKECDLSSYGQRRVQALSKSAKKGDIAAVACGSNPHVSQSVDAQLASVKSTVTGKQKL